MLLIRSIIFNIFLITWTLALGIVGMPFLLSFRASHKIGKIWANVILFVLDKLCGIKHQIKGLENLPEKPFIIASKHQSAWETIMFLKIFSHTCFILKKELVFLPVYGLYLLSMKMIPLNRSKGTKSIRTLQKHIRENIARKREIVIFPEGTRSQIGEKKKYKRGIYAVYNAADVTVIPVALNSGLFWGKNSFVKKPGTITLEFLKPIQPGMKRDEFMAELEGRIEKKSRELEII